MMLRANNGWASKLDPYERSFRIVRTHVLIKKDKALSSESLLEAIALGHCYLSFDTFGQAKGFSFTATGRVTEDPGRRDRFRERTELESQCALNSRFMLLKDGSVSDQKSGTSADFPNQHGRRLSGRSLSRFAPRTHQWPALDHLKSHLRETQTAARPAHIA